MFQAADPGDCALDSHSKAGMWHSAIFTEIEIPFERRLRQIVFANALQQKFIRADALRASDDLSISLGREHIHAQRNIRTLRIGFHVERLDLSRIAVNHHWSIELRRYVRLIGRAEISAPLELCFQLSFCVSSLQHGDSVIVAHPREWNPDVFELRDIAANEFEVASTSLKATPHDEADKILS